MVRRASPDSANKISAQLGWRDVARQRSAHAVGRFGCALSALEVVLGACAFRGLLTHWHPSPTAAGVLFAVALVAGRVRGRGAVPSRGKRRRAVAMARSQAMSGPGGRRATRSREFSRSRQRR